MTGLVLAASNWHTNAELIADVARLGYLRSEWLTLDMTPGRGIWWKTWRPDKLVTDGFEDFRDLPMEWGCRFQAVAYDPPYVCPGGRSTSTIQGFFDRYGLREVPATPELLQKDVIEPGLAEAHRVVEYGGIVLVKCKDYIWSGRMQLGTYWTLRYAFHLGFALVDRFEHIGSPGPQSQKTQVHARRNLSTLFVLRKDR